MTIQLSEEKRNRVITEYTGYLEDLSKLPVSFVYDDVQYTGFNGHFKEINRTVSHDGARHKEMTKISLLLGTELKIDVDLAVYKDYGAYEWTLYFTNVSDTPSAFLKDIHCGDVVFSGENPVLHSTNGDGTNGGSGPYSPYTVDFSKEDCFERYSETGRPTEKNFPYFNLQYGTGGVFLAVGWPAQWNARFTKEDDGKIRFVSGQKYFCAQLNPGETVRSPLMSFLFYEGRDIVTSMNLWRHWFIDCNARTIKGESFKPALFGATSTIYHEMVGATEENQIDAINQYLNHGIAMDYWWMDAGWYFKTGEESLEDWLPVGNWQVDTKRFPTKFKAISQYCHDHNMETLLWFEPELVRCPLDSLDENGVKKEWCLKGGPWYLVNYGNDEFVAWLTERVTQIMREGGISIYRQDWGHGNPAGDWANNDEPNRRGIVENHYVSGFLKFWDNLIQLNPDMMIDTCASGGGRLDLETMRRSVPLHKTDLYYDNYTFKQSMHQSLFGWFPYFGTNETAPEVDLYQLRSDYTGAIYVNFSGIYSDDFQWELLRDAFEEWKQVSEYIYCDYYPLLQWSSKDSEWRGWEFYDTEKNRACIQLFRPENAAMSEQTIQLYGLEESTVYEIRTVKGNLICRGSGKAFAQKD